MNIIIVIIIIIFFSAVEPCLALSLLFFRTGLLSVETAFNTED